jgi:hypothetical protein
MKLVTRDQAKAQVRQVDNSEDALIDTYILAASRLVINYLKGTKYVWSRYIDSAGDYVFDSSGNPEYQLDENDKKTVSEEVQAATLMLIGILYRDRDGQDPTLWKQGYLPEPVTACLYNLRDPSLA